MGADLEGLFREHGRVERLWFDDAFLQHLRQRATYAKHMVSVAEILEVHADAPRYFENTGRPAASSSHTGPSSDYSSRAPIIMVGRTQAGRYLCVPLMPTEELGTWCPRTAFEANRHHVERYLQSKGGRDHP